MKYIVYFLKGLFIGGTMLLPGVSGGTMAMVLGMYHRLIESVANLRRHFKKSLALLLPFAFGGVAGALLLSAPIGYLKDNWFLPVMYFFVGSIAGGVPMMMKKAFALSKEKRFGLRDALCIVIGAAIPVCIKLSESFIGNGIFGGHSGGIVSVLVGILVGVVCSVSLSLPGISTSYMLLILGVYDEVLAAFSTLDVLYLLPIACGAVGGLLLVSKFMERQLTLHPRASYTVILGFIAGSILSVFPYVLPVGIQWLICPVLFAVAFILMFMLSKLEK